MKPNPNEIERSQIVHVIIECIEDLAKYLEDMG
jgi:hypothetical protein